MHRFRHLSIGVYWQPYVVGGDFWFNTKYLEER